MAQASDVAFAELPQHGLGFKQLADAAKPTRHVIMGRRQ
jgi:hypothetical protein